MKTIKVAGIIILFVLAVFLIIPLFLADNVRIRSERIIDANPVTVFQQVNTLKNWKNWSPFEVDTTIVDTYEGPDSGVGAKHIWTSEKSGSGSLTIVENNPYSLIMTKLEFGPDMRGATGTWNFEETDSGVHLVWILHITNLKYPFERWYGLMSRSVMEPLMKKGLDSLKKIAEAMPEVTVPAVDIKLVELDSQPSLTILDSVTMDEIGEMLSANYGAIMAYIQQKEIAVAGFPFAVYYNWNPEGVIVIRAGIPVRQDVKGKDRIEFFELPAGTALYAKHFGGYNTGNTHYAIDDYIKANHIENLENYIWEVYVTDPLTEPDTAKWETDIYYPLK